MMRKTTSLATVALCSGVSFGVMPAEQLDIHISALMDPPSCSCLTFCRDDRVRNDSCFKA